MDQIIKELTEVKTEIKYLNKTLEKVEKILEQQWTILERQSVANKRIFDLEEADKSIETRVRKLEDWQIKIIAVSSVIWWFWAFILNKFI